MKRFDVSEKDIEIHAAGVFGAAATFKTQRWGKV